MIYLLVLSWQFID